MTLLFLRVPLVYFCKHPACVNHACDERGPSLSYKSLSGTVYVMHVRRNTVCVHYGRLFNSMTMCKL